MHASEWFYSSCPPWALVSLNLEVTHGSKPISIKQIVHLYNGCLRLSPTVLTQIRHAFTCLGLSWKKGHEPKLSGFQQPPQLSIELLSCQDLCDQPLQLCPPHRLLRPTTTGVGALRRGERQRKYAYRFVRYPKCMLWLSWRLFLTPKYIMRDLFCVCFWFCMSCWRQSKERVIDCFTAILSKNRVIAFCFLKIILSCYY